jgi:hypothetical protein
MAYDFPNEDFGLSSLNGQNSKVLPIGCHYGQKSLFLGLDEWDEQNSYDEDEQQEDF